MGRWSLAPVFLLLAAGLAVAQPDWMKSLPDQSSLAELTIPGTHDTCALYGGTYGQCQKSPLKEQLAAGVRFLDIRCRHMKDAFAIYHGPISQQITMAEVLTICSDFLAKQPSECLIMSVKEESQPVEATRTFAETFRETCLKDHASLWYRDAKIPRLGQVRGRIVLVARANGIDGVRWKDLSIQDDWKVPTRDAVPKKWEAVKKHLDASRTGKPADWHINFTSGSGLGAPPNIVAQTVHPNLKQYLKDHPAGRLGTVLLDFAEPDLVRELVKRNYQTP